MGRKVLEKVGGILVNRENFEKKYPHIIGSSFIQISAGRISEAVSQLAHSSSPMLPVAGNRGMVLQWVDSESGIYVVATCILCVVFGHGMAS